VDCQSTTRLPRSGKDPYRGFCGLTVRDPRQGDAHLGFGVLAWTDRPHRDKPLESLGCDAPVVINKTAVASKTDRRMPHIWIRIGDDVRRLRVEAGVSLRELADATGIDASYLARIERYRARPSLPTLTSISVALGADLSLRFYAGKGPRIHDRFQAPMIDTLLRSRHLAGCLASRSSSLRRLAASLTSYSPIVSDQCW
jgi:transcriptional regulator with XRE-family HTH domain